MNDTTEPRLTYFQVAKLAGCHPNTVARAVAMAEIATVPGITGRGTHPRITMSEALQVPHALQSSLKHRGRNTVDRYNLGIDTERTRSNQLIEITER